MQPYLDHRGSQGVACTLALCGMLLFEGLFAGATVSAAERASSRIERRHTSPRINLECTNLRRLNDNFVLDLKLRMSFNPVEPVYTRFENAGRGWQLVGRRPYSEITPARINIADDEAVTAYIERLTGDYYQIDHTGTGLSLWGRCTAVGMMWRYF